MGGLRGPARNALMADVVTASAYGRAYGFERMMDNLGAIIGPLLAIGLVATVGVRWAIGLSVIPGLLAAAAIVYAIRHTPKPQVRQRVPFRIRVRPVLRGELGRLMGAVVAFEVGNAAATLLILRATELLTPIHGAAAATTLALVLYTIYNASGALASLPAGRISDRLGRRGPVVVLAGGTAMFLAAYLGFALSGPQLAVLAVPFVAAGLAIGCVETAQHSAVASLAPAELRGSAFGLLATIQAGGNVAASTSAGILWTVFGPRVAFLYLATWMLIALSALLWMTVRPRTDRPD
jgi:MFS family permease